MNSTQSTDAPDVYEDEISLLELATALGQEKNTLLGFTGFSAAAAIAVSLLLPPVYTAKTLLIPPQQQGAAGTKLQPETFLSFLKSDVLADVLIDRYKLKEHYQAKTQTDAREQLGSDSKIALDKKTGLISIEVDHREPEQAAAIANGYMSEMKTMLAKFALSEVQQRLTFLESQLTLTQQRINTAKAGFLETQQTAGAHVLPEATLQAIKESTDLKLQTTKLNLQMATLRQFATKENIEVQRLSAELSGLRSQLAKLKPITDALGNTSDAPNSEGYKRYAQAKAYQTLVTEELGRGELLTEYDLIKIEAAREGYLLQQIDVAEAPEKKSKPKRALIVAVATVAGLFIGLLVAFVRRSALSAAQTPEGAEKLAALKKAWRWGA